MGIERAAYAFGSMAALLLAAAVLGRQPAKSDAGATTYVLPKGTYTSIVFTAFGAPDATAATGTIELGTEEFAVSIGPGSTIAIPFGSGWVLEKDAEVRLAPGAGTVLAVPHAWAITPAGPVSLRRR